MEKYALLPLGSVVYLREGNKKVLIIARGLITNSQNGELYFDYGGVPYPEGLQDDKMAYFQHDAVTRVVHTGYSDSDDEATVDKIFAYLDRHPGIKRGNVNQLLGRE